MAASSNKLQGKVAIITGGASGIGEATARTFINHTARAVVIADVQDEKGQELAQSLGPDRCVYMHCDVSDEDQVKTLVETTVKNYGQLDVMFCNAGVFYNTEHDQIVLDFDMSEYEKLFSVNVRGTAASVKHAARAMVEGKVKGSIICTASVVASMGTARTTDYTMSKHAVLGLMRCASKQLGGYGIRVNSVSPWAVATPMVCGLLEMGAEEVEKTFEKTYCLDGVIKAKHVADAVVFLASDESEFITGHDLVVDGGRVREAIISKRTRDGCECEARGESDGGGEGEGQGEHGGECGDSDRYGLHDVEARRGGADEVCQQAVGRVRDTREQRVAGGGGDTVAVQIVGDGSGGGGEEF